GDSADHPGHCDLARGPGGVQFGAIRVKVDWAGALGGGARAIDTLALAARLQRLSRVATGPAVRALGGARSPCQKSPADSTRRGGSVGLSPGMRTSGRFAGDSAASRAGGSWQSLCLGSGALVYGPGLAAFRVPGLFALDGEFLRLEDLPPRTERPAGPDRCGI